MFIPLILLKVPPLRAVLRCITSRRYRIEGDSMTPTYLHGNQVYIDRTIYRISQPQRGDVVVFNVSYAEGNTAKGMLKRIIGLPGERIQLKDRRVYVNDLPLDEPYAHSNDPAWDLEIVLEPGHYFLLGDNRGNSRDNIKLTPVKRQWLVGKVMEFSFKQRLFP